MRIVKNILIMLMGITPFLGFGQEIPFYSNYTINPLIYNPAHAGANEGLELFLHHRTQWSGFKGAPVSQLFTMSAPSSISRATSCIASRQFLGSI